VDASAGAWQALGVTYRGPAHDPKVLADILALRARGYSHERIGEAVGIPRRSVSRALARHEQGAPPQEPTRRPVPRPPVPRPPPDDDDPDPDAPAIDEGSEDALTRTRTLLADVRRQRLAAEASGDDVTAARLARVEATILPVLARVERASVEDEDVLRLSRADLSLAQHAVRERIRSLLSQPICCSECGRRLRIAWVEGGDGSEPEAPVPAE